MSDKGSLGYGSVPDVENTQVGPVEEPSELSKFIAEIIGTTTLVQIGCGGLCAATYLDQACGYWQTAALWILGGMIGLYASGSTSGGHLNPAVSLSFALVRPNDFSMRDMGIYWLAQIIGGVLAGILNMIIFFRAIGNFEKNEGIVRGDPDSIHSLVGFGDYWSDGVANSFHAFAIEAIGTAFLCFVVFAITHPKSKVPGSAVAPLVGCAIGCMVALLGALTGAGINPARDMGPRLVTRVMGWGPASMTGWLPYLVGPLVGGPIGASIAEYVLFKP